MLYQQGGLYVDAHSGAPDVKAIAGLFGTLAERDFSHGIWSSPADPVIRVANGVMLARRGSDIVAGVLSTLMGNVRWQLVLQERGDGAHYNIAALTGGWAIRMYLFRHDIQDLQPHAHLRDRIATLLMGKDGAPFKFYRHYGYRKPGAHWSERQAIEPLFN